MQASWRDDSKKCTFIVLSSELGDKQTDQLESSCTENMVGDVNLFFNDDEDPNCAEIEIMIAERELRRRGIALEALLLLIRYAKQYLKVSRLVAKIGKTNEPSLELFKRKLGFVEISFCEAFDEFTLELQLENEESKSFDDPLVILEDFDAESPVYESIDSVDQYLALHFGQTPTNAARTVSGLLPEELLQFPQRCAQWVSSISKQVGIEIQNRRVPTKALDLGCAVGGSSFELSKNFSFVRGVDKSCAFIAMAKQVRDHSSSHPPLTFSVPVEGARKMEGIPIMLDSSVDRARIEFSVGDACNLLPVKELGGPFDAVLLGNLLCRVEKPKELLISLKNVLKPKAVVIIVSPYSWTEEYTKRKEWLSEPLGGKTSDEIVKLIMEENGFRFVENRDMPLVIRDHSRRFQVVISSGLAFSQGC